MNATEFLIAHGEKLAVGAIAVFCVWQVHAVLTDETIRPGADLRLETLTREWSEIEKTALTVRPPVLKPAADHLGRMKERFSSPVPAPAALAWLTARPDLPPSTLDRLFLYLYEVLPVTVHAEDRVGTLALTIVLPEAVRPADKRHSDARSVTWARNEGGEVVNTAGVLGVQVEVKLLGGNWMPLNESKLSIGDGFIPLAKFPKDGKLSVDCIEPWSEHQFRARLVVRATGLPPAPTEDQLARSSRLATTILVWRGRFTESADNNLNWPLVTDRLRRERQAIAAGAMKPEQALLAGTLPPVEKPPAWAKLSPTERMYYGIWGPEAAVTATADIRFALKRVSQGTGTDFAEILVTRKLIDPAGGGAKWTEPFVFKVQPGEAVGKKDTAVPNPFKAGEKKPVDLDTPFQLESLKSDARRVWYWEVRLKSRPGAPKQKDIEVKPYERQSREAILRNPRSPNSPPVPMVQLDKIPRPSSSGIFRVFPWQYQDGYNELDEFLADPAVFKTYGKEPPRPKEFEANDGPLPELIKSRPELDLILPKTHYLVFGDGRMLWWDDVNTKARWYPDEPPAPKPEPAPKPAESAPAEKPAPPKAAPERAATPRAP